MGVCWTQQYKSNKSFWCDTYLHNSKFHKHFLTEFLRCWILDLVVIDILFEVSTELYRLVLSKNVENAFHKKRMLLMLSKPINSLLFKHKWHIIISIEKNKVEILDNERNYNKSSGLLPAEQSPKTNKDYKIYTIYYIEIILFLILHFCVLTFILSETQKCIY